MAVAECRECRGKVSADAAFCPSCGVAKPVKANDQGTDTFLGFVVVGGIAVTILAGAFLLLRAGAIWATGNRFLGAAILLVLALLLRGKGFVRGFVVPVTAAVLIVLLVTGGGPSKETKDLQSRRATTQVNVRAEPSASSRIVGSLNSGQIVEVDTSQSSGAWTAVLTSSGRVRGYVRSDFLSSEVGGHD